MGRHHREEQAGVSVPPVLPLVLVTVRSADDVEILIDGQLLASGPIDRSALGRVLASIVADQGVPVRVEITEADGRRFADIITPVPRPSRFAPPEPPAPPPAPQPRPLLHTVLAEGFVPGEDVGVAIIARSSSADGTGHARALIEASEFPERHLGVLLFGFVSGTVHWERPR